MIPVAMVLALLLQAAPAAPPDMLIQAELKKEVTSRRAKPGQEVRLVTMEDVLGRDGAVVIPAGAKLAGKLSLVRKRSDDAPAALAFVVDKAEWKGGSMPLNASLDVLQLMGMPEESGACMPNLNRASMSGCGAGGMAPQPVPADCKVDKVDEASTNAVLCSKHEVALGIGAVMVLRNRPSKP